MPSRFSVSMFAALLLVPATGIVSSPSPAFVDEVGASLKRTLEDYTPPAKIDSELLRTRIKTLRTALRSGNVEGDARRLARRMVRLYRAELDRRQQQGKPAGEQQPPPQNSPMPEEEQAPSGDED